MSANRDVTVTAIYQATWPTPLRVNLSSPLGAEHFAATFDLAKRVHYVWQSNGEIYFDHGSWRDNPATNAVEAWFASTGIQDAILSAYRETFDAMKADYAKQLREFASGLVKKADRVLAAKITLTSKEMYGEQIVFKPSAKYDSLVIYQKTLTYPEAR